MSPLTGLKDRGCVGVLQTCAPTALANSKLHLRGKRSATLSSYEVSHLKVMPLDNPRYQVSNHAPRFLPLLFLLSVLLWSYTTTGGQQVFVKEVLGGAYDSQVEHFLRGNVDADAAAIGHEAMLALIYLALAIPARSATALQAGILAIFSLARRSICEGGCQ
jgi:hypothetical protein